MKRFFSILLGIIVFLICACQPTPEVEYVVNKGDDVVEQKLSAPAEQEMKETKYQRFPDRAQSVVPSAPRLRSINRDVAYWAGASACAFQV